MKRSPKWTQVFKSRRGSKHRWCFSSAGSEHLLMSRRFHSWQLDCSPAHRLPPLCKPLSALTSCLTPPHPVDNVFSLSLALFFFPPPLLPSPRHGGSRCVTAGEERHGSSQVPPFPQLSIYLLIGKKIKKTDEPRVSAPCLFHIIVWDNRLTVGLKKKKKKVSARLFGVPPQVVCCVSGVVLVIALADNRPFDRKPLRFFVLDSWFGEMPFEYLDATQSCFHSHSFSSWNLNRLEEVKTFGRFFVQ